MSKPLLIGITGGIGSGKSTVSRFFEVLGIPVYYSDDRAKRLMVTDQHLVAQIKSAFGAESYFEDGSLNRVYLASSVFSNEEKLKTLNGFVHPAVGRDFETWVNENANQAYVLKEAALLFETGIYQQLDKTICVMAQKELRIERVLLRDAHRSKQEVEDIIAKQISDGQRKKLSDFLIDNNGSELLIPQVLKIHQELLNLFGQGV